MAASHTTSEDSTSSRQTQRNARWGRSLATHGDFPMATDTMHTSLSLWQRVQLKGAIHLGRVQAPVGKLELSFSRAHVGEFYSFAVGPLRALNSADVARLRSAAVVATDPGLEVAGIEVQGSVGVAEVVGDPHKGFRADSLLPPDFRR